MELWIRSQDKETLIKSKCIDIEYYGEDVYTTIIERLNNGKIQLGKYETKERALEVLDEIHQRLINLRTLEIAPDSYIVLPKDTSNVYEMPQE